MNSTDLQKRIHEIVDRLEIVISAWAKAKAEHNYETEMLKIVLNMQKSKSEAKSSIAKDEDAYISEEYKTQLWKLFGVDSNYYSLDGQKGLLEKELDACRSLLSFEREMTKRTI